MTWNNEDPPRPSPGAFGPDDARRARMLTEIIGDIDFAIRYWDNEIESYVERPNEDWRWAHERAERNLYVAAENIRYALSLIAEGAAR